MTDRSEPDKVPAAGDVEGLVQQFILEVLEKRNPDVEAYCARCPGQADELRRRLLAYLDIDGALNRLSGGSSEGSEESGQWVGRRLGDFEVIREIGRGGMGIVFLARQLSLDRMVALKVLGPHQFFSETAVERFQREASTVAKLQHPNIATVFAVGESDGFHYYAMEYIDGVSLDKVVDALREAPPNSRASEVCERVIRGENGAATSGGSEPFVPAGNDERKPDFWDKAYIEKACTLIADVALALQHAHAHGIIHRDVKPSNILITRQGTPKLVDFGLAKELGAASLTASHELFGTPYYMAPEQVQRSKDDVDQRTDVYSLGATLYELLTLHRPFEGSTSQEVLTKIATERPAPPRRINPALSRDLNTVVLHCLEDRPSSRYPSAEMLAEDVNRLLSYRPIVAKPPSLMARFTKMVRRHPARAAVVLIVVLCVGLATGLGFVYSKLQRETQARLQRERSEEVSIALQSGCSALMRALRANVQTVGDETGLDVRGKLLHEAKAHFEHVMRIDPRNDVAPVFSAAISLFLGEGLESNLERYATAKTLGERMASAALTRAWALELLGRQPEATAVMLSFVRERPTCAEDALMLGCLYFMAGDVKTALQHYEVAIAYSPTNYWAILGRAMCRMDLGQRDLAFQDLAAAEQIAPNRADTWIARGALEVYQGDLRQGIAYWEKAVSLEPANGSLRFRVGLVLCKAGRRDEGFASIEEAMKIDGSPSLAMQAAALHLSYGDMEGAIGISQRCASENPTIDTPTLVLSELLVMAGRVDEAKKLLERWESERGGPTEKEATSSRARRCLADIRRSVLGGAAGKSAVEDAPGSRESQERIGALTRVLGRGQAIVEPASGVRRADWIASSQEARMEASNLDQMSLGGGDADSVRKQCLGLIQCTNPIMSVLAAKHFERLGLKEDAVRAYERAIRLNPIYSDARSGLAFLLIELDRAREAFEQWELIRKNNPYDVSGYFGPAWVLLRDGRWDEAELYLTLGMEHMPFDPALHRDMAWCMIGMRRFEAAMAEAETYVALSDVDDARCHPPIGIIVGALLAHGEKARALALCKALVKLRPMSEDYRRYLEEARTWAGQTVSESVHIALVPGYQPDRPKRTSRLPEDWWSVVATARLLRTQGSLSILEDIGLLPRRIESGSEANPLEGLLRQLSIDVLVSLDVGKDQDGKMTLSVTAWRISEGRLQPGTKKQYSLDGPQDLLGASKDIAESSGVEFVPNAAKPEADALAAEWGHIGVLGEMTRSWAMGEKAQVQVTEAVASSTWLGASLRAYFLLPPFQQPWSVTWDKGPPQADASRAGNEAIKWHGVALEFSRKWGGLHAQVNSLCWRASAYKDTGNKDAAVRDIDEALSLAERCNYAAGTVEALSLLAGVHWEKGEIDAARDALSKALSLARKSRIVGKIPFLLCDRYWMDRVRGDEDLARVTLQKCAMYAKDIGYDEMGMSAYMSLAQLCVPTQAEDHWKTALAMAEKLGREDFVWQVHNGLALLKQDQKKYDEALTHLTQNLEFCRQRNDILGVAATLLALGNCEIAHENYAAALKYYEELVGIFRKLNAEDKCPAMIKDRIKAIELLLRGAPTAEKHN